MRRSREDTAETRRRIVETGSRLFRQRGISAVSVADVMGALGLTVGGFYRHFESKEALVVEAIEAASSEMVSTYATSGGDAAGVLPLRALLDGYLSKGHRDHPERGCPVAALCSEVAHEGEPTREAFSRSVQGLLGIIASLAPDDTSDGRDRRLHAVASMVGAVVLARATSDEALADDFLRVVRAHVLHEAPSAAGKAPQGKKGVEAQRRPPKK